MSTWRRRALSAALTVAAVGGVTLVSATPAAAVWDFTFNPTAWSYTDNRSVHESKTGREAHAGAWRDDEGKHHVSKMYFTFDLRSFATSRIVSAKLSIPLLDKSDCSPGAVEAWTADAVTKPTWADQPAERVRLAQADTFPCWLGWDVDSAVEDALGEGRQEITVVLRAREGAEGDPVLGRRLSAFAHMTIVSNHPPAAADRLSVDRVACGDASFSHTARPVLGGRFNDTDSSDALTARFAVWPVDAPAERTEWTVQTSTGPFAVGTPSPLAEGRTYAWAVQVADREDTGPWSPECRFFTDYTRPTVPTVTSPDFPDGGWHGGIGLPATFHVDAGGVEDVVAFEWSENGGPRGVAAAEQGRGSFVYTPTTIGRTVLEVVSIDRSGLRSERASIVFYVSWLHNPVVSGPTEMRPGVPTEFTFASGLTPFVSYTYQVQDGPPQTVAAGPDGTARVVITAVPSLSGVTVDVRGTTATGAVVGRTGYFVTLMSRPVVTNDVYPDFTEAGGPGVASTFTIEPGMPGIVAYQVQLMIWNDDGMFFEDSTVPAAADGRATMPWTPNAAGYHSFTFTGVTADGTTSQSTDYQPHVAA